MHKQMKVRSFSVYRVTVFVAAAAISALCSAFAVPAAKSPAQHSVATQTSRAQTATEQTDRARKPLSEVPILSWLKTEMDRSYSTLRKNSPPVYFIAYRLYYIDKASILAQPDCIREITPNHYFGNAQVEVRVGSRNLDNSHPHTASYEQPLGESPVPFYPAEEKALRQAFWCETESAYREALSEFGEVISSHDVQRETDKSPDFSVEGKLIAVDSPAESSGFLRDKENLMAEAREVAARFKRFPVLEFPGVEMTTQRIRRYLVNTEGTLVADERSIVRMTISASKTAKTGETVSCSDTLYWRNSSETLKDKQRVLDTVDKVAQTTLDLAKAPCASPYCGPVLLRGEATAVLFHEVLGHRVEASRHRNENDGRTFAGLLGDQILPPFISVYDRPLVEKFAGEALSGHYKIDEEGVRAQNVTLVKNGKLLGFLLNRRPASGFYHSNGHGRADPESEDLPQARMANLMVESNKTVSEAVLRQQLIAEARRQKKAYALLIERVSEGETQTSSDAAQVFQVTPSIVKRVYVDGRPDELVRGLRLVGTPMAALKRIIYTSDRARVFNGVCGAESGFIPQSNVAPSVLIDYMETERVQPDRAVAKVLPAPSEQNDKRGH